MASTVERHRQLPPRRVTARALLRALLTVTVLVVLYYALHFAGLFDAGAAGVLVAGLLAFAVTVTWQVRAILRADYPGLRSIEALATAIPRCSCLCSPRHTWCSTARPPGRSASR
jgi:hypothetical protein